MERRPREEPGLCGRRPRVYTRAAMNQDVAQPWAREPAAATPTRRTGRFDARKMPLLAWTVASFGLCALVPLLGASPYGDLSSNFTDHLHHSYGVWLFWKHGFAVLTTTFGNLSGAGYPHPVPNWSQTPWMYPPGALVFFAPLAWLAKTSSLTFHQFAVVAVLYTLLFGHVGIYLYARACAFVPGPLRLVLIVFGWLMFVRLAVEGFFDPFWLGCGAAMSAAVRRGRAERALLWFAVAASLHFRAVVFAPVAALALVQGLLPGGAPRPFRAWPWKGIAAAGVSSLATVIFFVRMYPATAAYRASAPSLSTFYGTTLFRVVLLVCIGAGLFLLWARAWVGAATVALGSFVAVSDFQGYLYFWHHAAIVLAAPLAVGLTARGQRAEWARQVTVLWGLALELLVWGTTPLDLLKVVVDKVHT